MLAGCGTTESQTTEAKSTEIETTEAKTSDDSGEISDIYADVESIKVLDVTDGMYEDEMSYDLTPDQVKVFIDSINKSDVKDKPPGCKGYYRLELYGKDGVLIDTLMVDYSRNVINSQGRVFSSAELESNLKSMEEANGITLNDVWSRTPGGNYFTLMSDGSFGEIIEITETSFDVGLDLKLSKDDINGLMEALNNTEISKKPIDKDDFKYKIEVLSEEGASIYIFVVDEDMRIYTEYGYEISGGGI
jgi:hypothetical protein